MSASKSVDRPRSPGDGISSFREIPREERTVRGLVRCAWSQIRRVVRIRRRGWRCRAVVLLGSCRPLGSRARHRVARGVGSTSEPFGYRRSPARFASR
jgi:hypothetical protein